MKRKSVLISGPAKKDIGRIVRYIRLDKPLAAERFKERFVAPCRIVYKERPGEIWILRVLHSRREFRLFD